MPIPKDSSEERMRLEFDNKLKIAGLDTFKKSLEKGFFSEVTIHCSASEESIGNLIVELDCNFGLHEILYHMESGTWGNTSQEEYNTDNSSLFLQALTALKKKNEMVLDVEELSIFLKDTTIIINKIFDQSIPYQLENILSKLAEHYVHFTKGLTEIPFEIYVPVFEEGPLGNDTTLLDIESDNNNENDFFKYWGLYFYSEDDAVVYELAKRSIVMGDLYMLNQ
ncbi:hypothetical protein [Spongiimicrobium sp. 3-5]|uniref:hypothetical protein n=1 Tax=Spongiimicrobium sp. 3-5 TaxID=3332596 RepID=UPI0039805AFC